MDFIHTNYPVENEYPKLVRDRIPEIIKKNEGVEAKTRILDNDAEFLDALLQKMVEESVELKNSVKNGNLEEELADVFEIISAILALQHKTNDEIIAIQNEKRIKRGGFEKRILMLAPAKRPPASG
ncbi:MAG TPA: nucleoside triphosphate pyrophosphohydrolase [Candidatus Paceibacterota bacterium]|nr:nucleoside triphosphate pyrophosphohydrolase [Candidatus Paceibacterota bacterium]